MGVRVEVLIALTGIMFLIFVWRSIRTSSIRPTFAWLWLIIATFLLSIPFFDSFYKWLSVSVIDIADARHMIYIPVIGFLLLYVFYMTILMSRMSDRIQELITHTAILENRIREIAQSDRARESSPLGIKQPGTST